MLSRLPVCRSVKWRTTGAPGLFVRVACSGCADATAVLAALVISTAPATAATV